MGLDFNKQFNENVFADALQKKADDVNTKKDVINDAEKYDDGTLKPNGDTILNGKIDLDKLDLSGKIKDQIVQAEKEAVMGEALGEVVKKEDFEPIGWINPGTQIPTGKDKFDDLSDLIKNEDVLKELGDNVQKEKFILDTGKVDFIGNDDRALKLLKNLLKALGCQVSDSDSKITAKDGTVYTKGKNEAVDKFFDRVIKAEQAKADKAKKAEEEKAKEEKADNSLFGFLKTSVKDTPIETLLNIVSNGVNNVLNNAKSLIESIKNQILAITPKEQTTNTTNTTEADKTNETPSDNKATAPKTVTGKDLQVTQVEMAMPSSYNYASMDSLKLEDEGTYYKVLVSAMKKYSVNNMYSNSKFEELAAKWEKTGYLVPSNEYMGIKLLLSFGEIGWKTGLTGVGFARTYLEENFYDSLKTQITSQLKAKGLNYSEINNVLNNVYDNAFDLASIRAVNNNVSDADWYSMSSMTTNPKNLVDTFFNEFNKVINEYIDNKNTSSKDFDTQDIDYHSCYDNNNSRYSYLTGATISRLAESDVKAGCEKIKAQLLTKAKEYCKNNGITFNQNVFDNYYNSAYSNATKKNDNGSYHSMYQITHELAENFKKDFVAWADSKK